MAARAVFPALLGNETIKSILADDLAKGTGAHAHILEGPRGSGKHTAALQIAAATLCENRNDPNLPLPCGSCSACRKILGGLSVDVLTVSNGDKATIGVDAIRAVKESLYVTPNDGEKKFYLIESAHLMTVQAQNALLLSLEEPPAFVRFLLLCEDASLLLETVRSRAPVLRMELFSPEYLKAYLTETFGTKKPDAQEKIARAAHLSGGSLGRAVELFRRGDAELKTYQTAEELTKLLLTGRKSACLAFVSSSLPKERQSTREVLALARFALRDLAADKKGGELLFYPPSEGTPDYGKKASIRRLTELSAALSEAEERLAANASQLTVMTALVMNL